LSHEGQKKCGWIFPKSKKADLEELLVSSEAQRIRNYFGAPDPALLETD